MTRAQAKEANEAVGEMFEAIPKSKRSGYFGHLNTVSLLLEELQRTLPESEKTDETSP